MNPLTSNVPRIAAESVVSVYHLSPLIRLTLLSLYVALTLPLPFLPQAAGPSFPGWLLWSLLGLGFVALYAALTERVLVTKEGIAVAYARWVPKFFRRGWSLSWAEIQAMKPRSTGQGGLVYYFLTKEGQAYLLPMRVAGFARLVDQVQHHTSIDMTDVRPLAQPWMYFVLMGCTLMLLLVDGWTIWTMVSQAPAL